MGSHLTPHFGFATLAAMRGCLGCLGVLVLVVVVFHYRSMFTRPLAKVVAPLLALATHSPARPTLAAPTRPPLVKPTTTQAGETLPPTGTPDNAVPDNNSAPVGNSTPDDSNGTPLEPVTPEATRPTDAPQLTLRPQQTVTNWNQAFRLPLQLPGPAVPSRPDNPRLAPLKAKIARSGIFAAYRELQDVYLQLGRYDDAAATYREEAGQYRKKGLEDAAIIDELKAARYATDARLFVDRLALPQELNTLYTGATLEPFVGCYIGAFIDRDDNLHSTYVDENWQLHRTPAEFTRLIGKPHGTYFMYLKYGQKFPLGWIEHCKADNVIPQIAWEPNNLNQVQNNDYLRSFAQACGATDWPIFIRYASEMNGTWTPYHNNPKLYRDKFRLVNSVLHQYAPRVATIWCVNNPPLNNVQDYYPGDSGCDWVGVNLYSVPYYENKASRPALLDSPLALLDPVYKLYARKKPIAICEYGASHKAQLDRALRNDFAINKMALMYGGLRCLYPRVKMIDWFDMDMFRYPQPGKTINDHNLTEQAAVAQAYHWQVSPDYFLGAPERLGDARPTLPRPVTFGQPVGGRTRFTVWVKTYTARPKVYLKIGPQIVYASNQPGAHTVDLDLSHFPPGRQPVTAYIYDDHNHFITSIASVVTVAQQP